MGFRHFVLLLFISAQLLSQGQAAPSHNQNLLSRAQKIASYFGLGPKASEPAQISRRGLERAADFLSDLEFLNERRYSNDTLGAVDTRFIPEFDTRLYYTATAKPGLDGKVGVVDPESKGIFIFFHGSGTVKAGGGNFALKMNRLSQLGYSAIGFDFPFHQDGSQNPELYDSKKFVDYIHTIVQTIRPGGLPVYFVGHSYGPEVISEVVTRYPYLARGAALISPGAFDETTRHWYQENTVKMPFMRDALAGGGNNLGAQWAGKVTKKFIWNKPGNRPDPTLVNPRLKIHIVYGDREEYVPGPLNADGSPAPLPRTYDVCEVYKKYFSAMKCTVEPDVGHYIFEHKDKNGYDVIMRTLLNLAGESVENEKAMKLARTEFLQKTRTPGDNNLSTYNKDIFFRQWIDRTVGLSHLLQLRAEKSEKKSQGIYNDYKTLLEQRDQVMLGNIRKLKDLAPEFYATVAVAMQGSEAKNFDKSPTLAKYRQFLNSPEAAQFLSQIIADEKVYVLPVKKQPSGRVTDPAQIEEYRRQRQEQRQSKPASGATNSAPACSEVAMGLDQAS
jgi:pimeloyl-ACP methyl ester carboxylesterase